MRGRHPILVLVMLAGSIALGAPGRAAVKANPTPAPKTTASKQPQSECMVDRGSHNNKARGDQTESQAPSIPRCPVNPLSVGGAPAYTSGNLASPLYQTMEGELFGETKTHWNWSSGDDYNAKGVKLDSRQNHDLTVAQTARYGITDDLSVAVHLVYDADSYVKIHPVSGPTTTRHDSGWEDPEFDAIYRVLDQPRFPFYLDLVPQYSPDWVSPNQAVGLAERVGYATGNLILEMDVTAHYNWSDRGGQQSFWNKKIAAEVFYQFDDRWSANANAGYHYSPDSSGDWKFNLHGQLNYYIVPDKLQASVEYEHDFISDDFKNRNRGGNFVGVRLGYLFELYTPAGR